MRFLAHLIASALLCLPLLCLPKMLCAEQVPVRFTEGLVHGFLALRSLQGKRLADGEVTQIAHGDRVTSHVVFHFRDGSLYEDTTVFTEHGSFRLLSDHLIERGPSFKQPMATFIDASTGQVTTRYKDGNKEKVISQKLNLPLDLVNGMIDTVLKDIQPSAQQTTLSMLVASPKPRLVQLVISPKGEEPFTSGSIKRRAVHYVMKIKIGGIAGLVAPMIGEQPKDTQIWILDSDAPAFLMSEGQLYNGGPIWRIEQTIPAFRGKGSKHPE